MILSWTKVHGPHRSPWKSFPSYKQAWVKLWFFKHSGLNCFRLPIKRDAVIPLRARSFPSPKNALWSLDVLGPKVLDKKILKRRQCTFNTSLVSCQSVWSFLSTNMNSLHSRMLCVKCWWNLLVESRE